MQVESGRVLSKISWVVIFLVRKLCCFSVLEPMRLCWSSSSPHASAQLAKPGKGVFFVVFSEEKSSFVVWYWGEDPRVF